MSTFDSLSSYFDPVSSHLTLPSSSDKNQQWVSSVDIYQQEFPALSNADLALFTLSSSSFQLSLREELYTLYQKEYTLRLADLGNLKNTNSPAQSISPILQQLISANITPIIIADTPAIIKHLHNGLTNINKPITLSYCHERINTSPLSRTLFKNSSTLLNYNHLGYQDYFVSPSTLQKFDHYYYNYFRIGRLRQHFKKVEPLLRGTDLFALNIGALRYADAPAQKEPSPNGFYAEEACRIARYAGISDAVKASCFCNISTEQNEYQLTAQLLSQMIWYFVDGYYHRSGETPFTESDNYTKYLVDIEEVTHQLVFWKSPHTARWWMEVPYPPSSSSSPYLIPCTYEDYQRANKGKLPEQWLNTYRRLNYIASED